MANRLADATSPYLQQHADNPVDWHPWDDAALARARADDKPILLSIGYSACHWCHVMAHESFEDPRVAAVMNEHFVNIKVDREERPDLDQIYQTAHALMTRRSGGWPLTMFLTPAGEPYFAGTYFPKHARHGLPGFVDLLPRAASAYHDQRERVTAQGQQLRAALATLEPAGSATALPLQASQRALQELKQSFDPLHGGFGAAPKFPHPAELEYCLRAGVVTDDPEALAVVRTTLEKMAGGGIVDQIGGGFFRYSVDAEWSIPHFEKMLYDNGPLLALYADLSRVTGDARHGDVARGIVAWLVREMRSPDGAFYSSLDADSDGCEGQFYVWTRDAAQAAMTADEWMVAEPHFGFDAPPNFEQHAWHLRVAAAIAQVARNLDIVPPDAQTRLAGARAALFAARATRVRPDRDDKILTAWNALTIAGLARAARALDEPRWADLASACVDALRQTAWRDGRLRATRRGARAELNAYLDDHAFLLLALLESMQTRFRVQDFEWATQVAGVLLEWFEDVEAGGFFFTSHDHEKLFHRPKPGRDNATPSGNGVAAQALVALGHLAGNQRYVDAANRAVRVFAPGLDETPGGHSTLLAAMDAVESPPTIVLLQGDADACREWQSALEAVYRPGVITINLAGVGELPAVLVKGALPATGGVAWICRGAHCLPPVFAWEVIERTVASTGADGAR